MTNIVKIYFTNLYAKYNKLVLTKKELCEELDISLRTLNNRIALNMDIPSYIKGEGLNAKVLFPLDAVCTFLASKRVAINGTGGQHEL